MGYRSLAECVADLQAPRPARRDRRGDRPPPGGRRDPAPGLRGGGPGAALPPGQGDAPSRWSATCSARSSATRFLFRDTLDAVRHLVELKVSPAAASRDPWRYRGVPFDGPAPAAEAGPPRADPRRTRRRSTGCRSSSRWPRRRRAVRHAAAGLHRGPRPARPGEVEPGDVPRPALGQRLRAGPRGRPALPDPPRDRRPPRGGDPPGRAAAGQRLRRRAARDDGRRRDAAARRAARTELRRGAGRPTRPRWSPPTGGLPMPAEADFVICRHHRPARQQARRARSATTSAITAWRTTSRSCGSSGSTTAPGRSGRSPPSAGRRRRTRRSAS